MPESCPACHRLNIRRIPGKDGPDMLNCLDCAAQWEVPEMVGRVAQYKPQLQGGRDLTLGRWGQR